MALQWMQIIVAMRNQKSSVRDTTQVHHLNALYETRVNTALLEIAAIIWGETQ